MRIRQKYSAKKTEDPQAKELNLMMNDVELSITLGRYLDEVLNKRFDGNLKKFAKWVNEHLDRDGQTVCRKILISRNAEVLRQADIVRLTDSYVVLDLLGSCKLSRLGEKI